jgi:hypothetical protein
MKTIFKENLKKVSFLFQKKIRSKVDMNKDVDFGFVPALRKSGCYLEKEFANKNSLAKDIIHAYSNIDKKKIKNLVKKNSLSLNRYNYRVYITNFFKKKLLIKYAEQKIFLDNFRQYFGLEPKIRFISVWLDYPTTDKQEKNSQLFHRDNDDFFLVKTFLCLTDIDYENGPFQFINKSHIDPWKSKTCFYLKDRDNFSQTQKKISTIIARKGDLYMADTNGFHKGLILKKRFRVLLNVHYSSGKPKVGFPKNIVN